MLLAFLFAACGGDDTPPVGLFDRTAMLQNYADRVVMPAYEALLAETEGLDSSITALLDAPTVANIAAARGQLFQLMLAWEDANSFNFGPAGEQGLSKSLVEEIATFPVSTDKVEDFIASGDTSLNNFDRDSRGMYTLSYLLNAPADLSVRLQEPHYQAYLRAVMRNMKERIEAVHTAWQNNYATDFVARAGTDVGSGTSQLYNEFVRSFEAIKNFKVGLPAGMRPGQTGPEPDLVEARFSSKSRELLGAHLESIWRIYEGKALDKSSGKSLADYVEAVEGGPELAASTREQWDKVMAAYAALPQNKSLQELAAEEAPELIALHTELQKHTRFFKSDMSSVLGIAITFASGDGD
ncbi:MAG: imelysin family protein [Bacteroidia bacterium]